MFPKSFNRVFEVWKYQVGHGQLLLRSTKNDECPTRIDLGFKDVVYVQLPTLVNVASVRVGGATELPSAVGAELDLQGRKVFVLESDCVGGIIVAGFAAWSEDVGEYHEPSPVLPTLL
jgi:hypothetical protein